jgi:hypothetical protein
MAYIVSTPTSPEPYPSLPFSHAARIISPNQPTANNILRTVAYSYLTRSIVAESDDVLLEGHPVVRLPAGFTITSKTGSLRTNADIIADGELTINCDTDLAIDHHVVAQQGALVVSSRGKVTVTAGGSLEAPGHQITVDAAGAHLDGAIVAARLNIVSSSTLLLEQSGGQRGAPRRNLAEEGLSGSRSRRLTTTSTMHSTMDISMLAKGDVTFGAYRVTGPLTVVRTFLSLSLSLSSRTHAHAHAHAHLRATHNIHERDKRMRS